MGSATFRGALVSRRKLIRSKRGTMIGGQDHVISLEPTYQRIRFLLQLIFLMWPKARFCGADEKESVPLRDMIYQPLMRREFFIYLDEDAERSWNDQGATKKNDAKMVHLLLGRGRFTLVSGDSKEAVTMAKELVTSIQVNWGVTQ